MINSRAVVLATVVGTVLQLAMVLAGHSNAGATSRLSSSRPER